MSEWLTTGQMIDRLKIGEQAECVEYPDDVSKGWIATKTKRGIETSNGDGFDGVIYLNHACLKAKWRILPKYVTFEEAMKALGEGKKVKFHYKDWNGQIIYGQYLGDSLVSGYTFANLIKGKWTIE